MTVNAILQKILVVGLLGVILITPFIISSSLFFPFITGKNFFFRIAVEILGAGWVILAIMDRRFRPVSSPVFYAMAAVIGVLVLSTIFGANPYHSFWSNYERMEGLVSHLHLAAYFLLLVSIFKSDVDWRRMFYAFSGAGAFGALYGYLQALGIVVISQQSGSRVDGTFGNASYMAVFMLFSVFISALLFFKSEKQWQKILFASLFLLEIPVVFLTATRGTVLGLLGALILASLLFVLVSRSRGVWLCAAGVVGGIVALTAIFFLIRETDFARSNYALARFRVISLKERTVESRLTIWKMAFQGLKERPFLGWGLENFSQVFNKQYEPSLWRQEAWFDRAHNVFFDWLIAGGIAGIIAYLGLWGSALYILWRPGGVKPRSFSMTAESIVLTSLFAGYFFHNFFVFDNLVSYYIFFSMLGYIHYQYVHERGITGGRGRSVSVSAHAFFITPRLILGAGATVLILVFTVYFVTIKPYWGARGLLDALREISVNGRKPDLVLGRFEKVFSYHTFGTGEAREQLAAYANSVVSSDMPQADKLNVLTAAVREMEKQIDDAPDDARAFIMLASLYSTGGRYDDAMAAIRQALSLSPKKQQFYFILADIYLMMGKTDAAQKELQFAYDLDRTHHGALLNVALVAVLNGQAEHAEKMLSEFYGTSVIPEKKLVTTYIRVRDWSRAVEIWKKIIEAEPQNTQNRVSLAATYVQMGDRALAIRTIEEAAALDSSFQAQALELIQDIRVGKIPD